jgi:hypothetical protein
LEGDRIRSWTPAPQWNCIVDGQARAAGEGKGGRERCSASGGVDEMAGRCRVGPLAPHVPLCGPRPGKAEKENQQRQQAGLCFSIYTYSSTVPMPHARQTMYVQYTLLAWRGLARPVLVCSMEEDEEEEEAAAAARAGAIAFRILLGLANLGRDERSEREALRARFCPPGR